MKVLDYRFILLLRKDTRKCVFANINNYKQRDSGAARDNTTDALVVSKLRKSGLSERVAHCEIKRTERPF